MKLTQTLEVFSPIEKKREKKESIYPTTYAVETQKVPFYTHNLPDCPAIEKERNANLILFTWNKKCYPVYDNGEEA